jgi:AcrR family transcriptional regulator
MEEVARRAGVGIGTLYRHFPNRSDLVIEVYRTEISKLVEQAQLLANSKPPLEALRSWLLLFVDHLADSIVLGDAVKTLAGAQAKADAADTDRLNRSLGVLFERLVEQGKIADPGIEPLDLVRALYGIATAGPSPDWEKTARRMVDVLIGGLSSPQ